MQVSLRKPKPYIRMLVYHLNGQSRLLKFFGDLDPRIDNHEADLEAGEVWSGFHAIEKKSYGQKKYYRRHQRTWPAADC